jgi:hypothetical protein
MLECYNSSQDPTKLINLHLAIRWIVRSWNHFVTDTTIYNCFRKSILLTTPITLPTPLNLPGIGELYQAVTRAGNIQDSMSISNFLNPIDEEEVIDSGSNQEDLLQQVIGEHIGSEEQDEDEDDQFIELVRPEYTLQNAREALQILINFTEGRDDIETSHLRAIERLDHTLEALDLNRRVQSTLDRWIT